MRGTKLKLIMPDGKAREIRVEKSSIDKILEALSINPIEVIVAKNGKIVSEYEGVEDEDVVKVIRIIHGG
jgi:sulfur carrier protein